MDRLAIFVDAGYLYAQGSVAVCGRKQSRTDTVLDPEKAVNHLKKFANKRVPDTKLLRIYWYDGAIAGARLTPVQATLAHLNDVKLRLGFVNSRGDQYANIAASRDLIWGISDKDRHLIENAFCRLKDFRRVATRYDKLARNFLSTVALVTLVAFWL